MTAVPDAATLAETAKRWAKRSELAGWVLETTRMAKSGYAPRKAELARWVIEARRDIDALLAALEAAQAERDEWKATAETAQDHDTLNQLLESTQEELAAALAERDEARRALDARDAWQQRFRNAEAERDAALARIQQLEQALAMIDEPYPIDVFPDLENKEEVFAAMRSVNKYATEQLWAECARQRARVAREWLTRADEGRPEGNQ